MGLLAQLIIGWLFGTGLVISGMIASRKEDRADWLHTT